MYIVNQLKRYIRTVPITDELYYRFSYVMTKLAPMFYCKLLYLSLCSQHLDLKKPKSLDEKSIWLKLNLYKDNPLIQKCTDKFRVREYVNDCGCGEIVNELYGVWDSVDEIQLDRLPERFVLKCNHSSGDVQICTNKRTFDFEQAKEILRKSLRRDYSVYGVELMYKNIPRKIVCERYLDASPLPIPNDYKFFCFNGVPQYIMFCTGREHGHAKYYIYDLDWKLQDITYDSEKLSDSDIQVMEMYKPSSLLKMVEYAKRLSKPFPFVRVDLYEITGRVVFGEMTFANTGGFDSYILLPEYNLKMGELLQLPLRRW